MLSNDKRQKQVEQQIEVMSRQVEEMNNRIRAYLADRQHQPHPRHLEFIQKVQNFRIAPDIANRHLETLLDNLQWKVYYHQKSWKQLWENAESARPAARPEPERSPAAAGEKSPHSQYSVDNLWEIQKEKLRNYGIISSGESKSQFKERIMAEYKKLNRMKKQGQDIVMSFERDSNRCRLELKDK